MSRIPHRRARLLAVTALVAVPLAVAAVPAQAVPTATGLPPAVEGSIPGAWIVTLEPGASSEHVANEHARRHGAGVDHVYSAALRGYAARMSDQQAARIAQDARVASVQRDQVVSLDAKPGGGSGGTQPAETVPTGVRRINGGGGAVDVDVAVLDTGIAPHPDLRIVGGVNCAVGKSYADGHGHGTHVAGTIGAADNDIGVVGVAPGARLHAVRVLNNQGSGTLSGILCGINWVTERADVIEVANMSLGGPGTDPAGAGCGTLNAYHDAICTSVGAGVTYVVAAGNEAEDAAGHVPAAYDEVITVSALADSDGVAGGGAWPSTACRPDGEDTFADFSNFGSDVDLIAPGVCVNSTWLGNGYNTISGTSMAAPHVAGAAALWLAENPDAQRADNPAQVRQALLGNATSSWDISTDPDGAGGVDPLLSVAGF